MKDFENKSIFFLLRMFTTSKVVKKINQFGFFFLDPKNDYICGERIGPFILICVSLFLPGAPSFSLRAFSVAFLEIGNTAVCRVRLEQS